MSKAIVIVHGLFMSPIIMKVLEKRFQQLGYHTYNFGYPSRKYSPRVLERLHAICSAIKEDNIYFLGHSLGGIVINHYVTQFKISSKCRSTVTLATPYNGSCIAQFFSDTKYGEILFGHDQTEQTLITGTNQIAPLPVGTIIGTKNIGIGLAFGVQQGDGTVSLGEADLSWASDRITLPLNHTALIYSKRVVKVTDHFFQKGQFN